MERERPYRGGIDPHGSSDRGNPSTQSPAGTRGPLRLGKRPQTSTLVCGYDHDGVSVALGKDGARNLHTGEVTGEDPLRPYAPEDLKGYGHATLETRAWQVRRVMDFPHAGDLMVISTVYPDGTVAALEELIGNHGGLGGEQTDAFLFHPSDMAVPPTRNSTDVFHILNEAGARSSCPSWAFSLPSWCRYLQ